MGEKALGHRGSRAGGQRGGPRHLGHAEGGAFGSAHRPVQAIGQQRQFGGDVVRQFLLEEGAEAVGEDAAGQHHRAQAGQGEPELAAQPAGQFQPVAALDAVADQRRRQRHRQHRPQQLHRQTAGGEHRLVIEPAGRRQRRFRHDQPGKQPVKAEQGREGDQPEAGRAGEAAGVAGQRQRHHRPGRQRQQIAAEAVAGGETEKQRAGGDQRQQRRQGQRQRRPQPGRDDPASRRGPEQRERGGQHHQPQQPEPAGIAQAERGEVEPLITAMAGAEQTEPIPARLGPRGAAHRIGGISEDDERQPVTEEDVIELNLPEINHS